MRDFSLYDIFARNSSVCGDRVALVFEGRDVSFAELQKQVDSLAFYLQSKGVAGGDRVAVLALNHSGFFVLLGAVARLGAILVPLNWRLSIGELQYIVEDSSPKILFTDGEQLENGQQVVADLPVPVVQYVDVGIPGEQSGSYDDSEHNFGGDDPCCIIYTAAIEGKPRGAVLSHTNLLSANLQVIALMGLSESDVNLNMLPLFHITGLNLALAVLQVGGKNIITEKFDDAKTLELTLQEKVTLWGSFPPILQRMTALVQESKEKVPSLKYVVGLDGPDNIETFENLCDAKFWILYGQAETSGFVTFSPASARFGSAGKQGMLCRYRLVDEEENPVSVGEDGEIVVQGPLVFQGYWQLEEANAKCFRNGWHHTGDMGQQDSDGFLYFKGRKPEKELIKPGGENVYPAEVEAVILEHPDVTAVSVIGVPDPKFGEGVKAVCVLKEGKELDAKTLIEFVASQIARYKKPGYVEFVKELPLKDGEIDRDEVKKRYGQQ